jgi:hypothetical protein
MKLFKWTVVAAGIAVTTLVFMYWRRFPSGAGRPALDDLSKKELYRRAQAVGIQGRSQMNRAELIRALRVTEAASKARA